MCKNRQITYKLNGFMLSLWVSRRRFRIDPLYKNKFHLLYFRHSHLYSGDCVKHNSFLLLNTCVTRPSCFFETRFGKASTCVSRVYFVFKITNQIAYQETREKQVFSAIFSGNVVTNQYRSFAFVCDVDNAKIAIQHKSVRSDYPKTAILLWLAHHLYPLNSK